MKVKPYVGITGFKTEQEIKTIGKLFEESGFTGQSDYTSMFGYLVSSKRLANREVGGKQSPSARDLGRLVRVSPEGSIPMLHYYTKDKDNLAAEVEELFSMDDIYNDCSAIQINMDWPHLNQIEQIKKRFPEMQIVFQIPKRASEGLSVEQITSRSKDYDSLVSYALIDPSGGLGIPFDVSQSTELMIALGEAMPNTIMAVAGGFSGENVEERVKAIRTNFSAPFCIDAQGRLRSKTAEGSVLDFSKVREYIEGAKKGFN